VCAGCDCGEMIECGVVEFLLDSEECEDASYRIGCLEGICNSNATCVQRIEKKVLDRLFAWVKARKVTADQVGFVLYIICAKCADVEMRKSVIQFCVIHPIKKELQACIVSKVMFDGNEEIYDMLKSLGLIDVVAECMHDSENVSNDSVACCVEVMVMLTFGLEKYMQWVIDLDIDFVMLMRNSKRCVQVHVARCISNIAATWKYRSASVPHLIELMKKSKRFESSVVYELIRGVYYIFAARHTPLTDMLHESGTLKASLAYMGENADCDWMLLTAMETVSVDKLAQIRNDDKVFAKMANLAGDNKWDAPTCARYMRLWNLIKFDTTHVTNELGRPSAD